ncbi:MAG TPA: hypothetical protein PLP01_02925 [Phycisphaerae bacterium]|nr:hypothetical protein [Phycisphaerae bacterium]
MTSKRLPAKRGAEPPDALDRAILGLLAKLPLTWKALDVDGLSAVEQEALLMLTAGGLVERRCSVRLRLIGHAMAVEATVTATGEHGLVEGFEPVVKAAWQAWAGEYLRGKAGGPADQPTFHCEPLGPQEARLSKEGQQARADVEAGQARMVLDFLHKRAPVFAGKVVRGYGRAEKIETRPAPAQPVQVELVNTGPMAALAETVQKLFEAQAKAQADSRPDDLVTTEIAVEQFFVSEATIRRKIKAGELRDYRPADAPKNAKLLLSRAELSRLFARKK